MNLFEYAAKFEKLANEKGPRVLNVIPDGNRYLITGFHDGSTQPLYLRGHYPESETPEIVSIKGAKAMHSALYDEWQVSDELGAEAKLGDGILFKTPFGDFRTIGVHVVKAEDYEKAFDSQKRYRAIADEMHRLEEAEMERAGWGEARRREVEQEYGPTFNTWPNELEKSYWDAQHKASRATEHLRKKLREHDY